MKSDFKTKWAFLEVGPLLDEPVTEEKWLLMTKEPIPGSKKTPFLNQVKLIKDELDYQVPSPIEAAVSVLMHFIKTGEELLPLNLVGGWDEESSQTTTNEQIKFGEIDYRIVCGCFNSKKGIHSPDGGIYLNVQKNEFFIDENENPLSGICPLKYLD